MTVLSLGIGLFVGMLGGGMVARRLYQLNPGYPALFSGIASIVACAPFYLLFNAVHADTPRLQIGSITFVGGLLGGVTGPIVKAMLQNVTLPTSRGQAFALFNTFDDFGRGLGPVFVAFLIILLGGRAAAFNVGILGFALNGTIILMTSLTAGPDEDRVQAILTSRIYAAAATDEET